MGVRKSKGAWESQNPRWAQVKTAFGPSGTAVSVILRD